MKSEYLYGLRQKVSPAPKIKKLGAIKIGMEQTPVVYKGVPYLVESRLPNKECPNQHICIVNLKTGEESVIFGEKYHFASAYAEGDALYVFASSQRDDKPLTMYVGEDQSAWHDPRGGSTIRMFKTTDLKNFEIKDMVTDKTKRFWNTSVCKGEDGYVMAIEVSGFDAYPNEHIGQAFTCFFAKSKDIENWELLPDECSYTPKRYNACPVIRYADGWYYMICLETLPCARYVSYIYRTKNFADWEVGLHNPVMMYGDDDRKIKEGCTLTEEETQLLMTGLNINNSDIDLFEWEGKTIIYYANGDQMSYSFLCQAEYDGPLSEFLQAFFK